MVKLGDCHIYVLADKLTFVYIIIIQVGSCDIECKGTCAGDGKITSTLSVNFLSIT
jgi:hypothetical protein